MRITSKLRKKALSSIVEYLASVESATRNEIFDNAIMLCGLKCEQLYDTSPKSKYSILKSYLGTALNDLLNKKHVIRDGEKYRLAREELIIVKEDMAHDEIKSFLSHGLYTKDEIFSHLEGFFGTDATLSTRDDYTLRSMAGNILFELTQNGEIEIVENKYTLSNELEKATNLDTPLPEKEFKPKFFKNLWLRGGSFFENFVANHLEKFYSLSGKMVVYCDVSGGSDDGGIDVVLEIVDYLGFVEKIKVQTKNRDKAQVTEKEIREFYGAMNAQRGPRGIYVTTTYFHSSAQDLIDSLDDLVGIDADKLWDLIKRTQYGITKTKDLYSFDKEIFN